MLAQFRAFGEVEYADAELVAEDLQDLTPLADTDIWLG